MYAAWGRPSPLDELRTQSGYFPDLSNNEDAQSVCTYQDESEPKSNMAMNQSMLSFETVRTNERLLDKLDLSVEDEAILHQALKEEEEKSRAYDLRQQQSGPIICMPASKFPSLRMKNLITVKDLDNKIRKQSLQGLNLRGNTSSSAVEQHYPAKSRYSYLAEEDSDSEYWTDSFGNLNLNENVEIRGSDPKVVNFERYRVESANLLAQYSQIVPNNQRLKRNHSLQAVITSSETPEPTTATIIQRGDRLYQNGSSNSTNTSFVEPGQLSKPKTQSSMESDLSLNSFGKNKDKPQDIHTHTPQKSTSSPSIDSAFFKDISKEPSPSFKTHKKKSSFSFKNLFKSPKSVKSKGSLEAKEGYDEITVPQSSGESSPRKKSQLRKFIFPANPVVQFEPQTPQTSSKLVRRKAHHFRSLSDFHKMPPSVPHTRFHSVDKEDDCEVSPIAQSKPRRKLSLDSRRPAVTVSSFNTPPHSRQQSRNHLQFYNDRMEESPDSSNAQDNLDLSPDFQIKTAIRMRNGGQLEESAGRLHKACLANDKTAFLLYGLALRHGCGVPKDYNKSFYYIKAAANVDSEVDEVFKCNIDPFELELKDSMPKVVPEPLAPALYECGVAYLKGYGPEPRNELLGLKYLEKAASLGHIDSMCLSATIWSKKSASRKKDIARAAAWFRLAEKRGANLIGSEWIHKDKYKKNT